LQISIRTGLSIGILALVALTAALVDVPWQIESRRNVAELDGRINALVVETVGAKIDQLLNEAVAARNAIGQNIESGATDIADRDKAEPLFIALLESQPNLSAIEFGWEDDRSIRVRRATGGALVSEETVPVDDTETEARRLSRGYRVDGAGRLTMTAGATTHSDYFATQQFWYKSAFTQDNPVWSNIYRLPASGAYGVTNAQTIERGGAVMGVLGVSISLDTLSRFLDGVKVGETGSVFLTNTAGQLVAAQAAIPAMMADPGAPVKLTRLSESDIPAVRVVAHVLAAAPVALDALKGPVQLDLRDAEFGERYFVNLAPLPQMGLVVAVVLPEAELLGRIDRNNERLLIALALFVLIVLGAGTFAARGLLGVPLARVTANLRQLEDFRFEKIMAVPSVFAELRQVSAATARMGASLASFKKYIPTELVRTLFAQGIEAELGGEVRELTILFMDLAGFTALSERLGEGIVGVLGDYLSAMSTEIQNRRGTIDKYIGDAVMAFWGAPVPDADHALNACRAALDCQAALVALRASNAGRELGAVHARIGINTGRVLVGNIGSHDRLNYSVIGDAVNVASRLESLNKQYGTAIMIGAATVEAAGAERLILRRLDTVGVYGREGGVDVYELIGSRESGAATPAWIADYESGLAALRRRDWEGAIAVFERVIEARGGLDGPSSLQIARARAFKLTPPPDGWDGMVVMESK
jgi:adenylate cyclase